MPGAQVCGRRCFAGFRTANLHVRRVKRGTPSTHPATGAQEYPAYRALHRVVAHAVQEFLAGVTSFPDSYPETATKPSTSAWMVRRPYRGDAGVDCGAGLWPAFRMAIPAWRSPQCSNCLHMIRSLLRGWGLASRPRGPTRKTHPWASKAYCGHFSLSPPRAGRPARYGEPSRLDTMPSQRSEQARL